MNRIGSVGGFRYSIRFPFRLLHSISARTAEMSFRLFVCFFNSPADLMNGSRMSRDRRDVAIVADEATMDGRFF